MKPQHDFIYLYSVVCTANQSKHYIALAQMALILKSSPQFLPCMSASLALGVAWVSLCVVAGEDDDDLYEALARARRAAEKQKKQGGANLQDTLAEQLASRRDQDEAHQAMDTDRDQTAGRRLPHPAWLYHTLFAQPGAQLACSTIALIIIQAMPCSAGR